VLADTKEKRARAKQAELKGKKLENLDPQLRQASGFAFYNTSRYDFEKLLADAPNLAGQPAQLHRGLQPQHARGAREVRLRQHHQQARRGGLLFQVLERFKNVDLHPDRIDNPTMGTIFEELIRKFNEALNENPASTSRRATWCT
jgi:type I restriction enzyme M protein